MKVSADLPNLIDGVKLITELSNAGIDYDKDEKGQYIYPSLDGDQNFFIYVNEKDAELAKEIVKKHKG